MCNEEGPSCRTILVVLYAVHVVLVFGFSLGLWFEEGYAKRCCSSAASTCFEFSKWTLAQKRILADYGRPSNLGFCALSPEWANLVPCGSEYLDVGKARTCGSTDDAHREACMSSYSTAYFLCIVCFSYVAGAAVMLLFYGVSKCHHEAWIWLAGVIGFCAGCLLVAIMIMTIVFAAETRDDDPIRFQRLDTEEDFPGCPLMTMMVFNSWSRAYGLSIGCALASWLVLPVLLSGLVVACTSNEQAK